MNVRMRRLDHQCSGIYSSSSTYPPLGRSTCPTILLFSMLCLFLEFPVSILHHPVYELLSRPSSSPLPLHPSLHYLCRELPVRLCLIQFFCLVLIISIKGLFYSTFFNASSFVLFWTIIKQVILASLAEHS